MDKIKLNSHLKKLFNDFEDKMDIWDKKFWNKLIYALNKIFDKLNFEIKTKIDSLLLKLVNKIIMSFEIW